jgi:hypothetical protein
MRGISWLAEDMMLCQRRTRPHGMTYYMFWYWDHKIIWWNKLRYIFEKKVYLTFHDILFLSYCQGSHCLHTLGFRKVLQYYSTYFITLNLPNMSLLRAEGGNFQHILYHVFTLHNTDCFYERVCWAGSAVSWTACVPSLGNSECTYSEDTLETTVIVNQKLKEQKVRRKSGWNCLRQRCESDGTSRSNKRDWMSSK